jgi:CRP-like cAMP-binding protein
MTARSSVQPGTQDAVRLLVAEPELARGIPDDERDEAVRRCTGRVVRLDAGAWSGLANVADRLDLSGFVVLDGMLCRETTLRARGIAEFLGPGDVVVPPKDGDGFVPSETEVVALTATRVIALGPDFAAAASRWPSILGALMRRLEAQRERLAVLGAIGHLARVEARILVAMWHLAGEWGAVTSAGVLLRFPFSHEALGHLVGARRPTISLAVKALEADGSLRRVSDGWLLPAGSEPSLDRALGAASGRGFARRLALRQHTQEIWAATRAVQAQAEQALRERRDGAG